MLFYQIDCFSEQQFKGYPTAVSIFNGKLSLKEQQEIAKEMGLSTTVFLNEKGKNTYEMESFTPNEIEMISVQGAMASAYILYLKNYADKSRPIRFEYAMGSCEAVLSKATIGLIFPEEKPVDILLVEEVSNAIQLPVENVCENRMDLIIEIKKENALKNYKADPVSLLKIPHNRSIVLTAKSKNYDYISRAFTPKRKFLEDGVSFSTQLGLVPYWSKKLAKSSLTAHQLSMPETILEMEYENSSIHFVGRSVGVFEIHLMKHISLLD